MTSRIIRIAALAAAAMLAATPAAAKDDPPPSIAHCDQPIGTIAITDGDQQGWTQLNLSSPRPMLAGLIAQSGCFTLHDPASGKGADFLLTAIAGSKEEVDRSMNLAQGAIAEGLVRSGAAGQVLAHVPMGGAMLGMFGRFGGKKKTVTAGLRIISPANGRTLAAGTGQTSKSFVHIAGWDGAGDYGTTADGKMLTGAYVQAFNALVAQKNALGGAAGTAASQ
ncbi:MAG TPA: SH3 domain-containing protein [Allosphingosinicella sp.]|nr:SH3 domain-containing protein [Allosphingosinicella sp.]